MKRIIEPVKIVDIAPETESLYFCCLEEWSDEMKEAGNHKRWWYGRMKEKGLRVKFAQDENQVIGGMIHYLPIEQSMFQGENLYAVLCIWVHGYKKGRGDFRKRGMGTALLKAAEDDCMALGANGLVVWGLALPFFMRASWFRKKGYKVVGKSGMMRLLWKPFNERAVPPTFRKARKLPQKGKEKVNVAIFRNGWCPAMDIAAERAIRASAEFKDKVDVVQYETTDRKILNEWGISDALFIDGREVRTGPPPSFEKIREKIKRRVSRISDQDD